MILLLSCCGCIDVQNFCEIAYSFRLLIASVKSPLLFVRHQVRSVPMRNICAMRIASNSKCSTADPEVVNLVE